MKKLFLPLLASLGMIAGFTLTSCGGGGGEGDTGNPVFTGKQLIAQDGSATYTITFGERIGGDSYECTVSDYAGRTASGITITLAGIKTDDEKKKKVSAFTCWISPNTFDRDGKAAFYYMISGLDVSNSAIQQISFDGNGVKGVYAKNGGDSGAGSIHWTAELSYDTKTNTSVETTEKSIDRTDVVVYFK